MHGTIGDGGIYAACSTRSGHLIQITPRFDLASHEATNMPSAPQTLAPQPLVPPTILCFAATRFFNFRLSE